MTICRSFYELLKDRMQLHCPHAKIIAHQIPLRFVNDGSHDNPGPEIFKKTRDLMNHKLCKLRTVDYVLAIGGSDWTRLDHSEYFRDGVHFEDFALEIQFDLIRNKLERILLQDQAQGAGAI